jgi:hypothetical protein
MRSAGRKQRISTPAMPGAMPGTVPGEQPGGTKCVAIVDESIHEELLSDDRVGHHRALEIVIHQRIEMRLPGRVRNLRVRSFDDLVILEGQCATYYTKQLAQHAAMGVLEEEKHLENAIVVNIGQ